MNSLWWLAPFATFTRISFDRRCKFFLEETETNPPVLFRCCIKIVTQRILAVIGTTVRDIEEKRFKGYKRKFVSRETFLVFSTNYAAALPFLSISTVCICSSNRDTTIQFAYPSVYTRDTRTRESSQNVINEGKVDFSCKESWNICHCTFLL